MYPWYWTRAQVFGVAWRNTVRFSEDSLRWIGTIYLGAHYSWNSLRNLLGSENAGSTTLSISPWVYKFVSFFKVNTSFQPGQRYFAPKVRARRWYVLKESEREQEGRREVHLHKRNPPFRVGNHKCYDFYCNKSSRNPKMTTEGKWQQNLKYVSMDKALIGYCRGGLAESELRKWARLLWRSEELPMCRVQNSRTSGWVSKRAGLGGACNVQGHTFIFWAR